MLTRRELCIALLGATTGSAAELAPLGDRLSRISAQVETFWKQVASVSCTESVVQLKIDPQKNKTLNSREAVYDYLVLLQLVGDDLRVEESRELQSESRKKKIKRPSHRPLLLTNGFALALLIFHPRFQSSYVFEDLEPEERDGILFHRIGFEHVRGEDSPSALMLEDRLYPLQWKGEAWIDTRSGHIARLVSALREPLTEIGLDQVEARVEYAPLDLSDPTVWMPVEASIEAATEHQLWRNTHRFTDYRRFQVETDFRIEDPNQP